MGTLCRHCHVNAVNRSRGLCWSCFYRPGVREHYPSRVRRGVGIGNGEVALPPEPTTALPGSPDKVEVLCQRARLHQSLWNKDDAFDATGEDTPHRPAQVLRHLAKPGQACPGISRRNERWVARCNNRYLGCFLTQAEAVEARRQALEQLAAVEPVAKLATAG